MTLDSVVCAGRQSEPNKKSCEDHYNTLYKIDVAHSLYSSHRQEINVRKKT